MKDALEDKLPSAWTGEDFLRFGAMTCYRTEKPKQDELVSDSTLCVAMLMVAARDGARITKIAKVLNVTADRLRPFFDRFVAGGVFTSSGKVNHGGWDDPEAGVEALLLDSMVGHGLLERVTT